MKKFNSLGLSENLLKVLEQKGFEEPTPIQEKAIPYLLSNAKSDFIGLAQTGTGKTAAFGLPLIDLVESESKHPQALILAPTRELGQQTAAQLVEFSAHYKKLNVEVVYGGAAITNQIRALKKPTQIVVATPGRLLDLIRRRAISLDKVGYVVLDEADEMLNMGFKEEIDNILATIKVEHSTWLFSATMPNEIRRIIKKYMQNPTEVSVNTEVKGNANITHQYIVTRTGDKLAALQRFLDIQPDMKGIMFCRTKRETQEITDQLAKEGYEVEALHGDLSQAQRDAAMRRFKARNMQLLVATDVAARGLDVDDLTHVFHHKLPDQLEAYTHRSGRTARAGKKGLSIAFINSREGRRISEIEKKLKVSFEVIEVPSIDKIKDLRIEQWIKQVHKMPIHAEAEKMYEQLEGHFMELEKKDLLLRLLSAELKNLEGNSGGNLNVSAERSKKQSANGPQRYFINIGKNDGLNDREMLDFLSEVSDIPKKYFGDLVLQDKRAFFDLERTKKDGFPEKFAGLEMDNGHEIRVNEENNRSQGRSGGGFKGKKGKGRGRREGGGKSFHRGGGNQRRKGGRNYKK
ncbi:MAG: DEAD/DEAH box helicase [Vicingaceae bacterium]